MIKALPFQGSAWWRGSTNAAIHMRTLLRVSEVGQFPLGWQRSSLLDRADTPGRGGELQQPVQQRAPNRGESNRTAMDTMGR